MSVPKRTSMVELDQHAKVLLNEIKSFLLKKNSQNPKIMEQTSYRAIVKTAIEQYHQKLIQNGN